MSYNENSGWETVDSFKGITNPNPDYIKNIIKSKRNIKRENDLSVIKIVQELNKNRTSLVN